MSYPPGLLTSGEDGVAAAFLAQLYMIFDSTWSRVEIKFVPDLAIHSLVDCRTGLVPLLHNFHAIVLHEEILCREFYDDLLVAKDHIAERLRLVDSPLRPKALSLRTTASTAPADLVRTDLETPLDEALERCVKNLGDLERLVRPAATRLDFLDDKDWRTARSCCSRTINAARARRTPTRRAPSSEWGRLVDRDAADDLDLAELLALTRGEDWAKRTRADPRDASLASTGPLVLDYKTKRAKTSR